MFRGLGRVVSGGGSVIGSMLLVDDSPAAIDLLLAFVVSIVLCIDSSISSSMFAAEDGVVVSIKRLCVGNTIEAQKR
jgi:hypothetical protein